MAKLSEIFELNSSEYGPVKKIYGVVRGICEYNIDPEGLCRIKVRVPSIHGACIGGADFLDTNVDTDGQTGQGITTEALPWAWPCFKSGGAYDSGDCDIPVIGAGVWVTFEQSNPDYPVWVGTWHSKPVRQTEANTIKSKNIPASDIDISMGTWMQPTGLSTPKETHDQIGKDPQVRVIAKTPKGATLLAIDTDESETLMLIDRSGQMIEMYSPVTTASNEGNAQQRGVKTARDNDSLDPSEYGKDNKAYIRIIDTSYQEDESGQRVWSGQFIKLSAEKDKEVVRIHGASGHDIYLDSSKNNHNIVIKDDKGNFIYFDKDSNIRIKTLADSKITVDGNALLDIKGYYKIKTGGNFEVDCDKFIVRSNDSEINGNSFIVKASTSTINGTGSASLLGGSATVGATGSVTINAGGSITESAASHTTTAGAIAHSAGSGSSPSVSGPTSPTSPDDPAGFVNIADETWPIG